MEPTASRNLQDVNVTEREHWEDGPPYELFKRLRNECPVHWTDKISEYPKEAGFWSVTTAEDIHAVSRDWGGQVYRDLGQPKLAIEPLEQAVKDMGDDPYDVGTARYYLALSLWDSGRDKRRAVEIAKQAAADLANAKAGEGLQQFRDKLAAFLALHK